jgi:rare lipoprotein A
MIRSRAFWCLAILWGLQGCACDIPEEEILSSGTLAPVRATSRPYKIKGNWYFPKQYYEHEETGESSWYGGRDGCHGLPTATGEKFDMFAYTAAHKTLPLPCVVRVTNLANGRQIDVKVNDRGPFKIDRSHTKERILDVSVGVAQELGFYSNGIAPVHIRTLIPETLALPENQRARERAALKGTPPQSPEVSLDAVLCGISTGTPLGARTPSRDQTSIEDLLKDF